MCLHQEDGRVRGSGYNARTGNNVSICPGVPYKKGPNSQKKKSESRSNCTNVQNLLSLLATPWSTLFIWPIFSFGWTRIRWPVPVIVRTFLAPLYFGIFSLYFCVLAADTVCIHCIAPGPGPDWKNSGFRPKNGNLPVSFTHKLSECFFILFPEQLYQDLQVLPDHLPAPQPVWAVPAGSQLLLSLPAHTSGSLGHEITNKATFIGPSVALSQ